MPPGFVAIMENHSGSRCRRRPACARKRHSEWVDLGYSITSSAAKEAYAARFQRVFEAGSYTVLGGA